LVLQQSSEGSPRQRVTSRAGAVATPCANSRSAIRSNVVGALPARSRGRIVGQFAAEKVLLHETSAFRAYRGDENGCATIVPLRLPSGNSLSRAYPGSAVPWRLTRTVGPLLNGWQMRLRPTTPPANPPAQTRSSVLLKSDHPDLQNRRLTHRGLRPAGQPVTVMQIS
jgi:hypothetical protein